MIGIEAVSQADQLAPHVIVVSLGVAQTLNARDQGFGDGDEVSKGESEWNPHEHVYIF